MVLFDFYFLAAFILILSAEVVQLISRRGVFDIDDLLLNMLGSIMGYGIYKLYLYCISIGGKHFESGSL